MKTEHKNNCKKRSLSESQQTDVKEPEETVTINPNKKPRKISQADAVSSTFDIVNSSSCIKFVGDLGKCTEVFLAKNYTGNGCSAAINPSIPRGTKTYIEFKIDKQKSFFIGIIRDNTGSTIFK